MTFMDFWKALNTRMGARGHDEVLHFDARHLWELFGENPDAAAEHESVLRRERWERGDSVHREVQMWLNPEASRTHEQAR